MSNTLKIPESLHEALVYLDDLANKNGVNINSYLNENDFVCQCHHTIGRQIRNNWGFWTKDSELYRQMTKAGLHHADDMSGLMLSSFYRYKTGKSLNINDEVEKYKKYWENTKID